MVTRSLVVLSWVTKSLNWAPVRVTWSGKWVPETGLMLTLGLALNEWVHKHDVYSTIM